MRGAWLLVLLLAGSGPRLDTQHTDCVDAIEVNTFGEQARTALIYREADGTIRDWRWLSGGNLPRQVRLGMWLAVWKDGNLLRTVHCRSVRWTRTLNDVEMTERSKLSDDRRTKLSK